MKLTLKGKNPVTSRSSKLEWGNNIRYYILLDSLNLVSLLVENTPRGKNYTHQLWSSSCSFVDSCFFAFGLYQGRLLGVAEDVVVTKEVVRFLLTKKK